MLSTSIAKKINHQLNLENYSINLYLQMSFWCQHQGFEGCYHFLQRQSREEAMHLKKLCDYVNSSGTLARLGELKSPPHNYKSLHGLFLIINEHEKLITNEINNLAAASLKEQDFCTFNFIQWFVAEQHEEETLFGGILDKFKLIGNKQEHLYLVDKYISRLNNTLES